MSFFNQSTHNHQSTIYDIADNLDNCKKAGDNFRANCPICESQSSRPFDIIVTLAMKKVEHLS